MTAQQIYKMFSSFLRRQLNAGVVGTLDYTPQTHDLSIFKAAQAAVKATGRVSAAEYDRSFMHERNYKLRSPT